MEDGKEFSFSLNAAFCKSSTAFADSLSFLFFFFQVSSFFIFNCIGVKLIYNVVLVSGVHQHE